MNMKRPTVAGYDCNTGETIEREMTDEEYAQLLADGWVPGDDQFEDPE